MRQKLQIVGWMAALLLSAVLWTAPAMAEEVKYNLWIAGKQLTSENCTDISKDNGFEGVTIADGGTFSYDAQNKKLVIKDVAVDSKALDAVKHKIVDLTIEVEGTNTLNAEGLAVGLRCLASTKLEGKGSLTITVKNIGIYFSVVNTELSISDITLNTSGQYGISGNGLSLPKLTINNAIVIAKGEQRAMDGWADLSLSNCAIVTPEVSEFRSGSIVDINADEWATKVEIAPTYGLYIAGKQVHALNCDKINSKNFPGVTIAEGGECRYDNEKRTLFMKNVTIEAGDGHSAVANGSIHNLRIKVEGKNYWKATDRSALYNGAEVMSIRGEEGKAQLEVTSRDSAAVCVKETVTVNYIDFTATGKWGVLGKDPTDQLCNFNLHFAKGTITATGTKEDECAVSNVYDMGYDDVLIREPIITPTDGGYKWPNKFFADKDGKKVKRIQFDRKYALNITTGYVDVDNCNNIPADPQFKHITVAQGGHFYYKNESKTLFMKDVTIDKPDRVHCAITNYGIEGLTIHLEGNNTWSVGQIGLLCQASTKITGNGTLTIRAQALTQYGFGIERNNDHPNITVDVSDITIEAHTPLFLHSAPFHDGTGKFTLNNVKATVHDGSLKDCDCTFKGCKIVSAEGVSPIVVDRIRVESVTFDPKEITRYVGDVPAAVPMPTVLPEEAGNKELVWTSDNEEVAKVDDKGLLVIGTKGMAHLTATAKDASGKKDQLTVHVRYHVDGVKLYQGTEEVSALTITEGTSVTLTAKVAPDGVPNGVEWVAEASEFTVTDKTAEKATFTALKAGDYTITAKAVEDTEKTATVNVKVLPKVASLTLNEKGKTEAIGKTVTFEVGETTTFEVKQLPAEALPLPVTWSATVSGQPTTDVTVVDGVVTVNKWIEGCEITAQVKVSDTETVKKSFTVIVLKPAPTKIKLDPKEFTIKSGESQEVIISFVGDEPFDEGVTVTPQDSEHFTVAQEGKKLTITGKKPTSEAVTLTVASTKDPNIKETCQVTVTKKAPTKIIIPESFSLAIEETKEMTVTFEGGDYIDKELDIEPKTNENIEIKQEGDKLIIKGTKLTTDPVTVTVKSKNFPAVPEATCQVTVTKKVPTAITIAQADKAFELTKEQTKVITLTFTPAEYVNQEVEVTVTPKDALTATAVDGKLTIKADKPFDKDTQVTVTVTSTVAPTVSDNCTVTLKYEDPGAVEDAALASIAVAPNPFATELRIENPEGVEGYYELLTAAGVAVRSGALDAHKIILNTEALPAGVYFLHIRQGELANTHKTIKVVKY